MLSVVVLFAIAPVARYPFALQLEGDPSAISAQHVHAGRDDSGLSAPRCEGSVSFVGKQAIDSYASLARQYFQQDANVGLTLYLSAVAPSVELKEDGWHAVVRHELELYDSGEVRLGSWTVEGRGHVVGLGEGALPAAFERATNMAARAFEAQFEEPAPVVARLATLGVAQGAVARRPALPEAPLPPPERAPGFRPTRSRSGLYFDTGARFAVLSHESTSRSANPTENGVASATEIATGLDLRLGATAGWFFAQAGFTSANARGGEIAHSLTTVGADLGALLQLNSALKLALGLGLSASRVAVSNYSFGPQPVTKSSWFAEPDLIAALRWTPPFGTRLRLHLTVEARYRLISFDTSMVNGAYQDHLDSGLSGALLLGVELPFSRETRP